MLGVLIGDGDGRARRTAATRLEEAGHHVLEASDGAYAIDLLRERSFDLVVCDLAMPRVPGLEVFRHVRRESPQTSVILTSASPTIEDAVIALKEGAVDFLMKPIDVDILCHGIVARIAERRALKTAFDEARAWLVGRIVGAALIGDSPPMRRVLELIDHVAQSDCAVLISGETGTGKDIVARTIYARGRRAARPFVTVECCLGEALAEELFDADGQLVAAGSGTLFFDEVADLPLSVQARLVHALENADGAGPRVLAATHYDLRAQMDGGRFRADLYFRLRTVDLVMPPLRDRKGDLSLLVRHLLERLTPAGFVAPGVAPRAWAALEAYDYPGNVRELARSIEHAMVMAHGSEIDREHLPLEIASFAHGQETMAPLSVARRHFEREYARRALAACDGDLERASDVLMVAPEVLERKLAGRSTMPPPQIPTPHPSSSAAFPVAEPSGSQGPGGPVKARSRASTDGAAAVQNEAPPATDVYAESYAKLRARTRER